MIWLVVFDTTEVACNTIGMDLNPFIEHPAEFNDETFGGEGLQYEFTFANGYGASVVRNPISYGDEAGLWEVAVLDSAGNLCYSTPITAKVLGWQSTEDVRNVLREIAGLA